MFDYFRAARERQPEQMEWHVGGCERAPAFDARGNRTAWQKGLRVRNSPTCTLSQNGYGDSCSAITLHCHSVKASSGDDAVAFQSSSLGAAFPAMLKYTTSPAEL
jgi:hypothetical protein